ncbi:MAG: cupin domain-containing protein [Alphaproteobacteria bacterium]
MRTWLAVTDALRAQEGIKRIPRARVALADVPGKTAFLAIAEVQPGVAAARHSHPGYEIGYMLEGVAVMQFDGEVPRTLKAGAAT